MSAQSTRKVVLQKEESLQKKTPVRVAVKKKKGSAKSHKLKLTEHTKSSGTKIAISNKTVQTLAKPPVTALAVPSPYRFPLPRTESLTFIARVIGICFVITGSIFSAATLSMHTGVFANLELEKQTAQTISTSSTNTTDPISITPAPIAPSVVIQVPGTQLQGVVPVTITAEVDRVELIAQGTGSMLKLGVAQRTDTPSVWRFEWDTRAFANGEYRLYAIVTRGNETYKNAFERTLYIQNIQASAILETETEIKTSAEENVENTTDTQTTDYTETTSSASEAQSAQTTSDQTTTDTTLNTPTVTLLVPQGSLTGSVPLRIQVPGAQSVRVAAYSAATGALYHAGTGIKVSETEWKLNWNTANVSDGNYRLLAHAFVGGVEYRSGGRMVTVENIPDDTTTTTSIEEPLEEPDEALDPVITLNFSKNSPLTEYTTVTVATEGARSVELYRQPLHSLAPFFLGKAQRGDGGKWSLVWNTRETPNGEYLIFARVTTEYGVADSVKKRVQVLNAAIGAFTEDQIQTIDTLTEVSDSLIQPTTTFVPATTSPNVVYIEPPETFVETVDAYDTDLRTELAETLREFRARLDTEINNLARALRTEDTEKIEEVRAAIEVLKNEILDRVPESDGREDILNRVGDYLDTITEELDSLTVRNTVLLKERIGETILDDSDKDGISDYDEIHLYQTNPFTADTDGDGFIDSVEITQGFNPHDARSEALIVYESPQETGVVREDLLEIRSVSTLSFERGEDTPEVQALFSGRGLPNSFVTLYIYSTPIVVTVKTDADGNWNYILDKDLEDGEHEVYVGITDNAGRLVAKSNPLPFVRTAEAYTDTSFNALPTTDVESVPAFISTHALLLASSVLIVVLGLVLLLIGTYVRPRTDMILPTTV